MYLQFSFKWMCSVLEMNLGNVRKVSKQNSNKLYKCIELFIFCKNCQLAILVVYGDFVEIWSFRSICIRGSSLDSRSWGGKNFSFYIYTVNINILIKLWKQDWFFKVHVYYSMCKALLCQDFFCKWFLELPFSYYIESIFVSK